MTLLLCKAGLHLKVLGKLTLEHVRWPMEALTSSHFASYELEAFEEVVTEEESQAVKVTEASSCICGRRRDRKVYYES
jgi:hypothetical protein